MDVSDDETLMTSGDGDRRRGVGPRQPVGSSIDDVVARREDELRIKLKVRHCGRRWQSDRWRLKGSSRRRR